MSSFNLATLAWTALTNLPSKVSRGVIVRYGLDMLYLINNNNPSNNNIMVFNVTTSTFGIASGLSAGGISGSGDVTALAVVDSMLKC